MDDRRGFLGRLLTFCGVAAVAPNVMALPGPKRDEGTFLSCEPALVEMKRLNGQTGWVPNRFVFRGWTFFWTGWKPAYPTDVYVGQWCAFEGVDKRDLKSRHFYSSYPGASGAYFPGYLFDISIKDWQKYVTWETSEAEKERYRLECLKELMRLIDENVAVAE